MPIFFLLNISLTFFPWWLLRRKREQGFIISTSYLSLNQLWIWISFLPWLSFIKFSSVQSWPYFLLLKPFWVMNLSVYIPTSIPRNSLHKNNRLLKGWPPKLKYAIIMHLKLLVTILLRIRITIIAIVVLYWIIKYITIYIYLLTY